MSEKLSTKGESSDAEQGQLTEWEQMANDVGEFDEEKAGVYDARELPLSSDPKIRIAQEKVLRGEKLSLAENIAVGRDHPIKEIDDYALKSNFAYRAMSEAELENCRKTGFVESMSKTEDEFEEGNNRGVDWYLGGVDPKYGDVVIEAPASKKFFQLTQDNGNGMSYDPTIKHIKSSGHKNPVPMSMVKVIRGPKD